MIGQESGQFEPKTIGSPLKGVELIDTFNAARLLFPHEEIEGVNRRRVQRRIQRLCQRGELEYFRVGHEYQIVKKSLYDFIARNHRKPSISDSD